MRNVFSAWLLLCGAAATQTGCVKPAPPVHVYNIGERVQVGPLIYNVFEANWLPQLGEPMQARRPARRFLLVHLSVTNSGAEVLSVPALSLLDDAGYVHTETFDGRNVPAWWGLIRKVKPADTLEGNILFDVQPKSYNLKLDDNSDPEHRAMVEMPLRFGLEERSMPGALSTPGQQ
jgi:hypothetical protein